MKSWYCEAPRLDVYANLAAEEWLLEAPPATAWGLFVWRSAAAVVIGKNQNPWRECDVPWLRTAGVPLARRISGGGAVWHDDGNLNFAFLGPRAEYAGAACHGLVCRALATFGIVATVGEHHALVVGGRKVSGNAFALRRGRALHHGTLLVNADLDRLRRALGGIRCAEARGIASNPAPVANLASLAPGLTAAALVAAIRREFAALHGPPQAIPFPPAATLAPAMARHRSWAWRCGRTPRFTIAGLTVDHGRLVAGSAARRGDRFQPDWISANALETLGN